MTPDAPPPTDRTAGGATEPGATEPVPPRLPQPGPTGSTSHSASPASPRLAEQLRDARPDAPRAAELLRRLETAVGDGIALLIEADR